MNVRSLIAATALVLPACAATGSELRAPTAARASIPQLDFTAHHLAFPALRGNPDLPSADDTAMHMQRVLGDSAAADVRLCIDTTGKVASAELIKSSGLASYDAGVLHDVRAWAFEAPSSATCTDLTIAYTLR
jgi:TonB family protein